MKITKTIFIAALMSFFLSCSSDSNEYTTTDNTTANALSPKTGDSDSLNFYDIVEIEDLNEQILVASALSADAKRQLWQDKLSDFTENNELTEQQVNYIVDLREEVNNENIFILDSEERNNFMNERSEIIIAELSDLLGENDAIYLLTKIENINQSADRITGAIGGPVDEVPAPANYCNCGGGGGGDNGCVMFGGYLADGRKNWLIGQCQDFGYCPGYEHWGGVTFFNGFTGTCVY